MKVDACGIYCQEAVLGYRLLQFVIWALGFYQQLRPVLPYQILRLRISC